MIAEPHGVEGGPRGDGQCRLGAVRMKCRHVARRFGIAGQGYAVTELHGETVAVTDHPIGYPRRRIEHDAPEIGMVT